MNKICVLSAAIGDRFKYLQTLTSKSIIDYCNLHRYSFVLDSLNSFKRPASWYKITAILKNLKNYNYLMWVDCDSIIVNKFCDINFLVNDTDHFFVSNDENGICCGAFIFRSCNVSKKFLIDVWNQTQFINNGWWEQKAIHFLVKENKHKNLKIRYLDSEVFHSKGYNVKSLIFHPAGQTLDWKINTFENICTKS